MSLKVIVLNFRIDGVLVDVSYGRNIMLSNSTVTVDIQPKKKVVGDTDDPVVVMVSFEFKAGRKKIQYHFYYLSKKFHTSVFFNHNFSLFYYGILAQIADDMHLQNLI